MAGRSRPSLRDLDAQRIALLKPSALGDIVHSLPILTALRHRFPHAHIAWIVNRAYEPLLHGHPDLDETIPFDRGAVRSGWWAAARSWLRFLRELRHKRFDLVVDLQGLLRTGVMAQATGAARRIGLSSAREGATWFYTDVIAVSQPHEMHAVDRYWLVAEALGVGDQPKHFRVPIAETARAWTLEQLRGCPRPWMAVGVGSRWLTKRWPPEHFAALTQRALERFGGTAVFVGGSDEAALAQAARQQLIGPARDLTGRTSLPQLAAVLEQADVMLANDTGPLHLAVALGRPVIAPYTCTKVVRTGPYHAAGGAVESRVWCQGSYLKRRSRMECMSELTPDRLWPLLHEVLLDMGEPQSFRLILASASPARRELLERLGISFEIKPAHIDEPETGFRDPRTMVQTISWLKAAAVALGHGRETMPQQEEGLILAADTIGWVNDHPILKPTDEADARRILRELGGRQHELWTGVTLWRRPDDLQIAWQERSLVHFTGLSDAEMDVYLATRSWREHSGAYAIMEKDDPYVRVVDGSVSNVIGLPMETLTRVLDWLWR